MLEGQIEEDPLDGPKKPIGAGGEPLVRDPAGLFVLGEGARGSPVDDPRHLVEQKDQRQPPPWRSGPVIEGAGRGRGGRLTESTRNEVVGLGALSPPQGGLRLTDLGIVLLVTEPEGEQFVADLSMGDSSFPYNQWASPGDSTLR